MIGERGELALRSMDLADSDMVAESEENCRLVESTISPNAPLGVIMGADSTPHASLGNDEAHQAGSYSFWLSLLAEGIVDPLSPQSVECQMVDPCLEDCGSLRVKILNSLSSKSEIVYTLRKQFGCHIVRPSITPVIEA